MTQPKKRFYPRTTWRRQSASGSEKNSSHSALRALAWVLGVSMVSCGGGVNDIKPETFVPQVLTGVAVNNGKAMANAHVYITCAAGYPDANNPSSVATRSFYTTTDANGTYRKAMSTSDAPCLVQATSADTGASVYGYAKVLGSEATAHVTPLTDAVVTATLGKKPPDTKPTSNGGAFIGIITLLGRQVALDAPAKNWATLSGTLRTTQISTVPSDLDAMAAEPDTATLQLPLNASQAGYFRLLQQLASNGYTTETLRALIVSKGRFQTVAGTEGAEVKDTITGLVWQRCVLGMRWDGNDCVGTATRYAWGETPAAVNAAPRSQVVGAERWRMPDYWVWQYVIDWVHEGEICDRGHPMDPAWFPSTPDEFAWTSTELTGKRPDGKLYVAYTAHLQNGTCDGGIETDSFFVRLVR